MTTVPNAPVNMIPPSPLARSIEHIPVTVYASSSQASQAVAHEIADLIRTKAAAGETAVLGLATGSTPTGVYTELVRLHREEGLSFQNVITFNLDEYFPIEPTALQSYHRFMREHLFDHIDIPADNINIPLGTIPRVNVYEHCEEYEQRIRDAGGLDFQLLGIGRTGHIGFNEPGSPRDSRTRMITLDKVTRLDAAGDFFGEHNVPRKAITMGVESILAARKIIIMGFGEGKAPIVQKAVEGPVTPSVSASFLQEHANAKFVLDQAAAAKLTRFDTPWLIGPLSEFNQQWDEKTTRHAGVWLSQLLKKPLLKLTDEDYNEHGLQDLLAARGSAYDINIEVFKAMQRTITGWPGGKPGRRTDKGESEIFPKRVVIFSPHPDDDVISMGGTFIRLCDQGHEVHVAYQTSGNIAVWDEDAERFADFMVEYCNTFGIDNSKVREIEDSISRFVVNKVPGEADPLPLQKIKSLIRRTEARSAAQYAGCRGKNIHFLDLPFYETGTVRKKPLGSLDISITKQLLADIKPHQIYAAGDLSDPHGTHRVCLRAVVQSLEELENEPWMKDCELWLYRGAWQEFETHELDMAVPLAPVEVERKRMAIFKHQSQKDRAVFPGHDPREFWERAEDRNRNTAREYDELGLAEYEAIEGFIRWRPEIRQYL